MKFSQCHDNTTSVLILHGQNQTRLHGLSARDEQRQDLCCTVRSVYSSASAQWVSRQLVSKNVTSFVGPEKVFNYFTLLHVCKRRQKRHRLSFLLDVQEPLFLWLQRNQFLASPLKVETEMRQTALGSFELFAQLLWRPLLPSFGLLFPSGFYSLVTSLLVTVCSVSTQVSCHPISPRREGRIDL